VSLSKGMLLLFGVFWINVIGSIYGYYFYSPQLSQTPTALLVFVPDCPLYTTLFALVIILAVLGYRNDLFNFIVSIGLVKYAIWTLFILSSFSGFYFQTSFDITVQAIILFVLHIGMFLEGLVFPFGKIRGWHVAAAFGWFLLNDLMDYFGPVLHPFIPPGGNVTLVMLATFAMTVGSVWLVTWLHGQGKRIDIGLEPAKRRTSRARA